MKLSLRIILVVIAVLVLLSAVLATISVDELRRSSERHLEAYLTLGLDQYVREYPQRLAELLEQHGLENIDSFVASYQTDAIQAATEAELEMGARIGLSAMSTGEFLAPGAGIATHVSDHIRSGNLDEGTIHFDEEARTYYVYDAFEPWGWIVVAAAPDHAVRDEIQSVLLRTTMTTVTIVGLAALVLFLGLRRFFVAPVLRIAAAARSLPDGSCVSLEETSRGDELGDLANDIVAAGETIRRAQQELSATNRDLERTVNERTAALNEALARQKTLVREVHHRVKNNMNVVYALLDLQKRNAATSQFVEALSDVQRRIAAMALIHEQLYRGDGGNSQLDASEYIGGVIEQLQRSFPTEESHVEIESVIQPVTLSTEIAMPCGLIINELVTTALKYAFVGRSFGKVIVRFGSTVDGSLRLTVADDGVGISGDPSSSTMKTDGIGTELVAALASQLHGTISRTSHGGLTVGVTF
ncbi:MAG: hypothetical protein PF508_15725 [Spirochaeta sp.]|nr:hypothetical protein [Spirochaeta sp.]